jgi:quinoprotein glucose dehydrogenase
MGSPRGIAKATPLAQEIKKGLIEPWAGWTSDLPLPTGIFNTGGDIVTGSCLIFAGPTQATSSGRWMSRAANPVAGALARRGPGDANDKSGRNDHQSILIAVGGYDGLGARKGDALVAYALPPS